MRQTVSISQKSLNRIDSGVCDNNVIITGLPEEQLQEPDGKILKTDKERVCLLLNKMDDARKSRVQALKRWVTIELL